MILFVILIVVILSIIFYFRFNPQFGGRVTKALELRYAQSPNWKTNRFENRQPAKMEMGPKHIPKLIREQLRKNIYNAPQKPIPIVPYSKTEFEKGEDKAKFIWYGHAAFLLHIGGKMISIDPMMGPDASPVGPMRTKRFSTDTLSFIEDWPPLDAVLITHDHYDHVDYASFTRIKDKVNHWIVALGVGRHLERWGVPSTQITEVDWYDQYQLGEVELIFTPTQHFSGRGLGDRGKSLWGGWVIRTNNEKIYFTGDGGYGSHFKEVGDKFGPFDLCISECGQYNDLWHAIHMYPEESVQAALDVRADVAIPFHWAGFKLAPHPWKEPIERFVEEASKKNLTIATPQLGEVFTIPTMSYNAWWEKIE